MKKPWTKDEDKFLRKHYIKGAVLMANLLNRSTRSVYNRAAFLGLKCAVFEKYNDQEIEYIKQNYKTLSYKEMGDVIGRSANGVKNVLRERVHLKRTAEESKNIRERCSKSTRFNPGNQPHNTRSDFEISERTHDGITYKFIRVALGKWIPLQIFNWEKVNGPVPEGKILRSISGDTMDVAPENWEPIDRVQHLIRNSNGRINLEDNYIAELLSRKNKHIKPAILQIPELIELKRNELKLRRTINELN